MNRKKINRLKVVLFVEVSGSFLYEKQENLRKYINQKFQ